MTLPPIPAIAAVLFCAALFILLFQYLFPRPRRGGWSAQRWWPAPSALMC